MNKADLVAKISKDADIPKAAAMQAIDSFTEHIIKAMQKGEDVTLVGFGTFTTSKRKARTGRNPQTGQTIKIAARKVPKFKAGKQLRDLINKSR